MNRLVPWLASMVLIAGIAGAQEFGPWSVPVNLNAANAALHGPLFNSPCNDMHPTLSKDGLSLIFSSTRPFDAAAIGCLPHLHLWVSQRDSVDSPWQTPQPLTMIDTPPGSPYEEHAPNLTTDGHWLYFHSIRPGTDDAPSCNGGGFRELYVSHRQDKRDDFGWEPPINLGCILNIPLADNAGPNEWEDASTGSLYLFFTRDPLPGGVGSDIPGNGFDIYVSTCTADLDTCNRQQLWGVPEPVSLFNSSGRDTRTALRRRDGLEMIITSGRCNSPIPNADASLCTTASRGKLDMWVSTRPSADASQDNWSPAPINLNDNNLAQCALAGIDAASCPVVNTGSNDAAPDLSWDGTTMIFYSDRAGGSGGNDLYVSTRARLVSK